jgi:hypothetical protein
MPPQDMASSPIPPNDSMTRDGSGGRGGVAMQVGGADDCVVIGQPIWNFYEAHPLPACWAASFGDMGIIARGRLVVDLDGDGDDERILVRHEGWEYDYQANTWRCVTRYQDFGGAVVGCPDGYEYDKSILWLETSTWTGTTVAVVQRTIFTNQSLWDYRWRLQQQNPGWIYMIDSWQLLDFRDIDGDGDLDLIVKIMGSRDTKGHPIEYFTLHIWFENTSAFNTSGGADVNRDGVVNGQDLAYVLSAWTP